MFDTEAAAGGTIERRKPELLNLQEFYTAFREHLPEEQKDWFQLVEVGNNSITLLHGAAVLSVQDRASGFDASFVALQCKEKNVYLYAAMLLESFANYFLSDSLPALSIVMYGAGFQATIPITKLSVEPIRSQGTLGIWGATHELSRIRGVIIRRLK